MSNGPTDNATIEVSVQVENDLEVDNDGYFHINTFIFPDDDDDPIETRVLFEDVIDSIIDFHRDDFTGAGHGQLYKIAHELDRHANNLRTVANQMEDREAMSAQEDMFNDL